MRLDVFKAKVAAKENIKASGQWEKLSSEEQRLVEKMVIDTLCLVPLLVLTLVNIDIRWYTSRLGSSRRKADRIDDFEEELATSLPRI